MLRFCESELREDNSLSASAEQSAARYFGEKKECLEEHAVSLLMMSEVGIREPTPSLRGDFLLFFDHVAFAIILIGLTVTVRPMRIRSGAN